MKTIRCIAACLLPFAFTSVAAGQTNTSRAEQKPLQLSAATRRADAKPLEDLEAAAQRLRASVHALAQAPAGPRRNEAIRDGNRALMAVNEAMANLPAEMLTAEGDESKYVQAAERLEQAAQRLRDATHALASDPYSTRRNQAVKDIRAALSETEKVMADVPISAWTESWSARRP
jgi:hypothetical protein